MNATSAFAGPPFNPTMLRWARERSQRTPEEAAKKLNTRPENIQSWERGDGAPTVRQARQLADFYERSFLEFFLSEPPRLTEPTLVPDLRTRQGTIVPSDSRELKGIQAWAEAMRENALDLYASLGEAPPLVPEEMHFGFEDSPERAAETSRSLTGPPLSNQVELATSQAPEFPKMLRSSLEARGILVLRDGQLAKFGARGMCLYAEPLPVIVFGPEAPGAQSFTMAHELAHVVLRQSAISGPTASEENQSEISRIETWCDRFAAAYLMPRSALMELWAKPNTPVVALGDDTLQRIASTFKVSRHAMLIRLVHLGYVAPDYYWNVKLPQFQEEERNFKSFGRPKYYGSRFRSACGDLYTGWF